MVKAGTSWGSGTTATLAAAAGWFGGLEISAVELALRLALLIGSAEGVAFLFRRHAAPLLAAVCTENLIRVADVMESPKLTE
jgi:hypothetical protein